MIEQMGIGVEMLLLLPLTTGHIQSTRIKWELKQNSIILLNILYIHTYSIYVYT